MAAIKTSMATSSRMVLFFMGYLSLRNLIKQRVRFFHPFHNPHAKRTAGFTAAAADAIRRRGGKAFIMGAQRGGNFRLHHSQIVELIHHRDVDAGRAGRTVPTIGALPVISVLGRASQYAGVVFFSVGCRFVGDGFVYMGGCIVPHQYAGYGRARKGIMQTLHRASALRRTAKSAPKTGVRLRSLSSP